VRRFSLAFALALVLAPLGVSAATISLYVGGDNVLTSPPLGLLGSDSHADKPGVSGPSTNPVTGLLPQVPSSALALGTTDPLNTALSVFTLSPPGSSCSGTGCINNPNGSGTTLESDPINFVLSGMQVTINGTPYSIGNISESATYSASYAGTILPCASGDGASPLSGQTDCLVWTGAANTWNGSTTLSEAIGSSGYALNVTYNNGSDWNIVNSSISFSVTGPSGSQTGIPEPASLGLLGTAIAGLGLLRRRRKAA
jgi:hypothetical protein